MRSQRIRSSVVLSLVIVGLWFAALLILAGPAGLVASGDRYNLPLWIGVHLSRAWLNPIARGLGGGYVGASESQIVEFLSDSSAIAAAERDLAFAQVTNGDEARAEETLNSKIRGVQILAWPVEDRLSDQLTDSIRANGLETALPLFSKIRVVWPPVAFAYDVPPYVLVQSPRRRIELNDTALLRSDLPASAAARYVRDVESKGDSALIVRIGGLAAYPSVVEADDTYADALDLLAHEWTHQYLFFHPLGVRYFENRAMTTINETVANMVGHELSADLRSRSPLAGVPTQFRSSSPPADRSISVNRVLHQLRLDVDDLLAQGNVAEAERKMNDTRGFLADHGYYLPPINQAYFAFYGTYADTAASTSPLGPRLASLRRLYPSLSSFVRAVQDLRSAEELTRLMAHASR